MECKMTQAYKERMCKRLAFESPHSMLIPACGCYIRDSDIVKLFRMPVAVPLKHIDYVIDIYDNLAAVTLIQDYTNPLDQHLELEYSFPVNPNICLHKFKAKFNDVELFGVIEEKQQAQKIYQEELKQGKQVAYAAIDEQSKDVINMKIGNVPGGANVRITIQFLQMLDVSLNTFWQLIIPSTISPRYMNDKAPPVSFPQMAKLPEKVNTQLPKYTWTFRINVKTNPNKRIVQYQSKTHDLLQLSINEAKTETTFVMEESCRPNKDFYFSYATENFNEPTAVLGRTDLSFSAAISFIPKFCDLTINDAVRMQMEGKEFECDIESAKGEYIFLLDRSGSMGKVRMDKAKEALSFFLRSLPQDIYYNVYSFGDACKGVFEDSFPYNNDTLKAAQKQISSMKSDMGGTNIGGPLEAILKKPLKKGYPRQVFILTDGAVNNTELIIQIVTQNIKYSRVHTIGVGNGASPALIQGCAESGKGKYTFIQDEENVSGKIIDLLGAAMSPVITNFEVDFDEKVVETISPNPTSMPYILKNEPVCLFVAFKSGFEGETELTLKYEDSLNKLPYEKTVTINSSSQASLAVVDKMVHHKALSILCDKLHDQQSLSTDIYLPKVKDLNNYIVNCSVKNQVLCQLTAFLCVGKAVGDAEGQKMKVQIATRITVPQSEPAEYQEDKRIRIGKGGYDRALPKTCKMSTQNMVRCCPESLRKDSSSVTNIVMKEAKKFMQSQQERDTEKQRSRVLYRQAPERQMERKRGLLGEKVEKKENANDKNDHSASTVDQLLDQQQTNGSWLYNRVAKELLLSIFKITESELTEFEKSYQNMDVVLTHLIVAWLEKHRNRPEYQLILRKARSWLAKSTKEAAVSEEDISKLMKSIEIQ